MAPPRLKGVSVRSRSGFGVWKLYGFAEWCRPRQLVLEAKSCQCEFKRAEIGLKMSAYFLNSCASDDPCGWEVDEGEEEGEGELGG